MNRRHDPVEERAVPASEADSGGERRDISRRRFMEVVAASAAAGIALPGAAGASAVSNATGVLSAGELKTLTTILNRIIPADADMPAAGDLGIAGFIDRALSVAPHLRRHIADVLAAIDRRALADSPDKIDAVLQGLERDHDESFDILLQATYTGYYSHPNVLSALRWVDPNESEHSVPPFDATLLAAVRRRAGRLDNA